MNKGMALHKTGQLDAADQCYRSVKRRDALYGEALRLRGVVAYQQSRTRDATTLLRRAVEQQPSNPVFHHTLGEMLRTAGDTKAAIGAYRRTFTLQPERAENGLDLADALARAGHSEDAIAVCRQLLAARPALGDAHTRIATLLFERGEPQSARDQIQAWQDCAPDEDATRCSIAAAWAGVGEYEQAAALYAAVLEPSPDHAPARAGLGSMRQSQGRFDESARHLERALDLDPAQDWIYAALMNNRRYPISAAHLETMHRRIEDPSVDDTGRSHLHFALGHFHDGREEPAEAFTHFQIANKLHARRHPFDPDVFDNRTERIIRHMDARFFARAASGGDASERPLFIVGMPRSGTSLVEQIVASHPQAFGAGELADLNRMVREVPAIAGTTEPFPECVDALKAEHIDALAQRYLGALAARAPGAARVTDKMPFNMLWLGFVARLFPNARVIYCRREPMDNCLSCYFQLFSRGLRFAYDLAHLGHVCRQHERLMAHWAKCLPLSMLTVDYEALVAEPDTQIPRLIEFAGLPWDDACLRFHEIARSVRTASVWQVRQPVYASSIARWRAYDPWLSALRNSLQREAEVSP